MAAIEMEKCPYTKSVLQWALRLGMMVLGTVGLLYLHLWVAVGYLVYSLVFIFLAMPMKHCQYCYYKVKETSTDRKTGKSVERRVSLKKWRESYLEKHVACGKRWGFTFFILFFLPIALIGVSFFLNFSMCAVICLVGFIGLLAAMLLYTRRRICPICAIKEECHSAF